MGAGGAAHAATVVTSSWVDASFIILGEILGTGVLGMPKVVADLGLAPGLLCILVFGVAGLYSGMLLSRTRELLQQRPDGPITVHSYGEAAYCVVGPRFGAFTRYAILVNWMLILPYYVMAASKSVMLMADALWGVQLCYYTASALVCAALLPVMQVQSLARLKGLALASTIAIVAVLSLIMYFVWAERHKSGGAAGGTAAVAEGVRWRALSLGLLGNDDGDAGDAAAAAAGATAEQPRALLSSTDDATLGEQVVEVINSMTNVLFAYVDRLPRCTCVRPVR